MKHVRSFLLVLSVTLLIGACTSDEPVSLTGDEPVKFSDFQKIFPELLLPYTLDDSILTRREPDSASIQIKLFSQFVPDSVITRIFGKIKPKIFPLGRVRGDAQYLFVKAAQSEKRGAWVFAFDKKDQLISFMPFLSLDAASNTFQSSSFDKRFAVSKLVSRRNSDGTVAEGRDVFDLDPDAKNFSLVMTDALDEKPAELENPIDTVSRKQKFTGDYGSGKNNLISLRDGWKTGQLRFFMHLEKSQECHSELKGEVMMKSANTAEYRQGGDPCSILFTFTGTSVTVKEIEGCGAHRSLRCTLNGVYPKKKTPVVKTPGAKTGTKTGKRTR